MKDTDTPRGVARLASALLLDADLLDAALSAPARNCDVGTAEEQYRRHQQYCDAIRDSPLDSHRCMDAPTCSFCFANWAQMPYAEGKEASNG